MHPPSVLTEQAGLVMVLAKPKFLPTQLLFHDACKYMLWPNACIFLKCREEKKLLLERD